MVSVLRPVYEIFAQLLGLPDAVLCWLSWSLIPHTLSLEFSLKFERKSRTDFFGFLSFFFGTSSFKSHMLWQPPNPDLYLFGPVKLIFPQLLPTRILTLLSKIIAPQVLPTFMTCQHLYQSFHMYVVFNRIGPILSNLS